jgi:hypothetical protein
MRNNKAIRVKNALATTSSAPTLATDGVAVPRQLLGRCFPFTRFETVVEANGGTTPALTTALLLSEDGKTVYIVLVKSAASGTRTAQVSLYGYLPGLLAETETAGAQDTLEDVASSAGWFLLTTTDAFSSASDFKRVVPFKFEDGETDTEGLALESGGNLDALVEDSAGAMDHVYDATNAADALSLSTSADKSSQLSSGWYVISANATCYFLQADSDADTDLDTAIAVGAPYVGTHMLPLGSSRLIKVTGSTNDYLAAAVLSGSGVLTISGPF